MPFTEFSSLKAAPVPDLFFLQTELVLEIDRCLTEQRAVLVLDTCDVVHELSVLGRGHFQTMDSRNRL